MNDAYNIQQYQRQIILPGFGIKAQEQLSKASVLVIGAGGLGCPALQYLAAAGIGTIGIADGDSIDITNLHRQTLYGNDDVGKLKTTVAAEKLSRQNAGCKFVLFDCFINKKNVFQVIEKFDIILDGSDNFSTRYLVNDACVLLQKPLVYGAIYRFEGQVSVFNFKLPDGSYSANYRDLFAQPPANILNCAEAGVIGVLPGIIGGMQAAEVIKIITGIGLPLFNTVLGYNVLNHQTFNINYKATQEGKLAIPADKNALLARSYDIDCSITNNDTEITAEAFTTILHDETFAFIDVRETGEIPEIDFFKHLKMPLSSFNALEINADKIVLFCQTGVRSKKAAATILELQPQKQVYTLKGGIALWLQQHIRQ